MSRATSWIVRGAAALGLPGTAIQTAAQTDYYNTDAGRPLRVEDAYPVERHAFELQVAPFRLERARGGVYRWRIEPEIGYGILPRTHVEVAAVTERVDGGGSPRRSGLAGIELSAFHNVNVETETLPATALSADVVLPVGALAPSDAYSSLQGIATRTYSWGRVHLNARFTLGPSVPAAAEQVEERNGGPEDVSRWMLGVAVDRAFPLRALLVAGELYARRPIRAGEDVALSAGAGARYQLDPRWAIDGGIGRTFTGRDRSWYVTFGTAYAFGLRWLIP